MHRDALAHILPGRLEQFVVDDELGAGMEKNARRIHVHRSLVGERGILRGLIRIAPSRMIEISSNDGLANFDKIKFGIEC